MPDRFAAPPDGRLDAGMRAAYDRDGFLVLEGFVQTDDCQSLIKRTVELVEGFDPLVEHGIFSSADQAHARDRYFQESGGKIRFFLEPDACDASGRLRVDKARALNKIGHALHDLDPVFATVSRRPRFAGLAASLGLERPLLLQSMYLFKQPGIGAEVGWHQDATFLYTEPLSVVGFWLALEDADAGNGCLVALPGAHRGPLRQRFRREGDDLVLQDIDRSPWPDIAPAALEVKRGTLVVLHGLLPHASSANRSLRSRQAYSLHVIDGAARYPSDNWLRRDGLPLRGFA